jgi:NAD(P)H-hydrate epimerase
MRYLSRQQLRDVDRRACEDYGLASLILMENAGRGCADLLCRLGISGKVVICCGHGNNGGDGFVIARHLDLRGKEVQVLLWGEPEKLTGDAAANYHVLQQSGVPTQCFAGATSTNEIAQYLENAAWIVDALLGTGSQGPPRAPLGAVIDLLNLTDARKLAIALPSGLDADTGIPAQPTFRADHTATFVAPKIGFLSPTARGYLGLVHVLDIGAPRVLVEQALAAGQTA